MYTRYHHTLLRSLLLLSSCVLLLSSRMQAQGWQRWYGGPGNERAFALSIQPDGQLVAVGSATDTSSADIDGYFLKTDSLGQQAQQQLWGQPGLDETALSIWPTGAGNWMVGSTVRTSGSTSAMADIQLLQLDAAGQVQNIWTYAAKTLFDTEKWGNDFLLLGGKMVSDGNGDFIPQFLVQKTSATGSILWSKVLEYGLYSRAETATVLPNNEVLIAGSVYGQGTQDNLLVTRLSNFGDSLDSWELPVTGSQRPAKLIQAQAGYYLLVATDGVGDPDQRDPVLVALDDQLDTLWTRRLILPGLQQVHDALELPGGDLVLVGEHIPEGSNSRDGFMARVNAQGGLVWFRTYGGLRGDICWDVAVPANGNGFIIAGQTGSYSAGGDLQAWLLQTDALGFAWTNRVAGRVVRDEIEDCVENSGEPGLSGWIITASGEPGAVYTLTDSSGEYSMGLDTGVWFVSVLPPSAYWSTCEDSIQVAVLQPGDTLYADFPVQAAYECPLLDVDLSVPFLRRCHENTYSVKYYNYGTIPAPDAWITVALDPYLTAVNSTLPYIQTGDTLLFQVGAVPELSGGSFQFTALLDCDSTVLGQTHCTEAHIYPDSLCFGFSPEWDGSSLEVNGYCAGDSVVITISNVGLDMQQAVEYIIVEDVIIFKLSTLQLNGGQDTTIVLYPEGATLTIIVNQAPGHPGNSTPTLVVEGCGGFPFSMGYSFQFPQNDGNFSTDIECRQNIGSYDPNDKTGLPLGVGDDHVVEQGMTIEYLIRFQNTGTDTAFRVEIRDTLSRFLDLATFKPGASSHPYQYNFSEFGILSFLFDPIALPDSGANEAASQGFVKYRIALKKDLAPGTEITNRAAIYFDQNTPVITAQTLHTIGNPFESLITAQQDPVNTNTTSGALRIAPNPTNGNALVSLTRPFQREGASLRVLDATGKIVLEETGVFYSNHETHYLNLTTLPAGLYLIQCIDKHRTMITQGKVVKL
ncbi:MAG TPA: T9SS type A sorting domain-containing protein [Saprospiraceae bacterium]|nr:T9SS type A sorting domain-containing protein [Saprospiraceae bacterium]